MTVTIPSLPLNRETIQTILPHRFPFLFIDEVLAIHPKEKITASKLLKDDEPCLAGHFPGFPIFPGVLQTEAIAQAGGILAYYSGVFDTKTEIPLLAGVEKAKFRKPVFPGEHLEIVAEIVSLRSKVCKIKGSISVRGTVTCEATITAVVKSKE